MRERHPNILSSSSLSGDKVVNAAGENLGEIEDLMIDLQDGCIAYCVLSYGGFLGMGDKLFAVPWEAVDVDTENQRFVLDVEEDVLKQAPGFDKGDWPSEPDRSFINKVHTHYGYDPYYSSESQTDIR